MNRPYVICHMLTSVDGKIDGEYMSVPECASAFTEYGNLRGVFDCEAALYGTTTMLGGYSDGLFGELTESGTECPQGDFIAEFDVNNFIVSLDPAGILGFNSGYIEKKKRPKAHVIEVLADTVSNEFTAYLRERGISYIFAGTAGKINCELLLNKLYGLFNIKRLLIAGGGITNWAFASEGLIDELSIVIAPAADGGTAATIFEKADFIPEKSPVAFDLKNVRQIGNAVHLQYTLKR